MRTTRRAAFTLVELLVTVSIFGGLLIFLVSTMVQAFRNFDSRSLRLDLLQQKHLFQTILRRDLRTATWSSDAPFLVGQSGIIFYRVAGIKVGGDGAIGMPEIHVVQYGWDESSRGIVRRTAGGSGLEERLFLRGLLEDVSSFTVNATFSPAADPMLLHLTFVPHENIVSTVTVPVFSRIMADPTDTWAQRWYDNWKVHPGVAGLFPSLTDYSQPTAVHDLSDRDSAFVADFGYVMGSEGLLLGN